ncbi:MAG: glycosyl transferase family 2 [Flavobacteriales bacterium]|nr:glycosyltransferase [Bacteroidales bacterium AH-315-I05]PCJ81818.1 MAG: glycosyl transferase family 2 [Flavobacteriales bacterium]
MLNNKTIAVVVPAFNEEKQISRVIETMPEFVDRIVVVNDSSKDKTAEIVERYIKNENRETVEIKSILKEVLDDEYNKAEQILQKKLKDEIVDFTPSKIINQTPEKERIILINQQKNTGVGGAISRGYKWCKDYGIDCIAVMAGDGQMDPTELKSICKPVVEEDIDYVKGNRLIHRSAWFVIPKIRYLGNSILSILTKVASGYWHVSDTQTGYTAISNKALNSINIAKIYKSYGMPNDMLVRLNIAFCTIKEVEIKPVYDIGEKSKMNIFWVIPRISWLLFFSFFKRLWVKYLFRDFHPLFLLYNFAFVLFILDIPLAINLIEKALVTGIKSSNQDVLVFIFLFISGFQSLLFAMWMDIQDNERLYK